MMRGEDLKPRESQRATDFKSFKLLNSLMLIKCIRWVEVVWRKLLPG